MTTLAFPIAHLAGNGQPLDKSELAELVGRIAAEEHSWASQVYLPSDGRRWWTRLHGDDLVDVWLLTWQPGCATDLHDHGDSTAAFTVVRGNLEEVRANREGRVATNLLQAGETALIPAGVIHDVRETDSEPAVSIHAYSPPLSRMTYYAPGPDGDLQVARVVHSDEPEHEPLDAD